MTELEAKSYLTNLVDANILTLYVSFEDYQHHSVLFIFIALSERM